MRHTQESYPTGEVPGEPREAVDVAERPRSAVVTLGGQEVTLNRLGTRNGLAVAQILLRYISHLREPMVALIKDKDLTDLQASEGIEIGMDLLSRLMEVLDDDQFLKLLSRLLGQPVEVVGDAPLEDTMNAMAEALAINDMPALLKAASRIWQEATRMANSL